MAERSTAAVDVADSSGERPLTAKADKATADGAEVTNQAGTHERDERAEGAGPARDIRISDLHSGHKLARRYRLEECVTRLDGFSSWRAVDEKLRRAVGVHLLPAEHPRARPVLAAARSAALLGDPRFVQVLDAVEENDLVYVVHEWLPDAVELTTVLASGPMEPHDAYQLVSQVSQAVATAHREGLAHLRLNPGSVLRTESGQYRIRGLAVMAALRGITAENPQRTDTEAIGALLYAALTQRWPYDSNAYGLPGLPKGVGLIAPDQVRAGVHRGLSELAMRALAAGGSTAARQDKACTTPEELAKAVAAMPRVRPPEPAFTPAPGDYPNRHAGYGQQPPHHGRATARPEPVPPPPPLQGRTGRVLKWSVSTLLIAALGLGSWQLADTLLKGRDDDGGTTAAQSNREETSEKPDAQPIPVQDAKGFAPDNNPDYPEKANLSHDGNESTAWRTRSYKDGPKMQLKEGAGILYDLGPGHKLSSATAHLLYAGGHTTMTLYATDSPSTRAPLSSLKKLQTQQTSASTITFSLDTPVATRYVLLWLTELPKSEYDEANYADPGYKQGIREVQFTG
ncbi:protein kinase family protein [Streptomyces gamaensis]|uniref:Protein kinase family protein n=1 Tax=Streptomyces gamaensis TaxID=1763542 RepID=A0ABW0YYK8_9ACTN